MEISKNKKQIASLIKYFEEKVHAVDRDAYALKCCKAMLLSTFVKILDEEPSEMAENWKLPRLKRMFEGDLFETKLNHEIDVAVGNPPWGNIDAPENPVELSDKGKINNKKKDKAIYKDDSDIGIYVVKRMLDGRMFRKSKNLELDFY